MRAMKVMRMPFGLRLVSWGLLLGAVALVRAGYAQESYQELIKEWMKDPEKAKMMGTQDGTLCNPVLKPVGDQGGLPAGGCRHGLLPARLGAEQQGRVLLRRHGAVLLLQGGTRRTHQAGSGHGKAPGAPLGANENDGPLGGLRR